MKGQDALALVSALRGKPDALLQLLLSLSTKRTMRRILYPPIYPEPIETWDLPEMKLGLKGVMRDYPQSSASVLGRLYVSVVDEESRKNFGQYFTDYSLARKVISQLRITPGESVLDAGCGTCVFATALMEHLGHAANKVRYFGVENNPLLTLAAATVLEGISAPSSWKILYGNYLNVGLRRFGSKSNGFDVIFSNPPYVRFHRILDKLDVSNNIREQTGIPLNGYSGLQTFFLAHSTTLLQPKGRMGFLLPIGIEEVGYGSRLFGRLKPAFSVSTGFQDDEFKFLIFQRRGLTETPLESSSRAKTTLLGLFAEVHRGISTGANDFFVLTDQMCREYAIPRGFATHVYPPKTALEGSEYTEARWEKQKDLGARCFLLEVGKKPPFDALPAQIRDYLEIGEQKGVPSIWTCSSQSPWYSIRISRPPDFIFSYISHGKPFFAYNSCKVHILTNVLGIYLRAHRNYERSRMIDLADSLTADVRRWVRKGFGRRYSKGLVKFEPGDLGLLPLSRETVRLLGGRNSKSITEFM